MSSMSEGRMVAAAGAGNEGQQPRAAWAGPIKEAQTDSGFRRAVKRELEGAKDVQQALLPPESFCIPCLGCETFYQPAQEIGGDYYDFLELEGSRWGIAIGDVSGKGIGAALIMASLQASLRAQALHLHQDIAALIAEVNRLVHDSSPTHFFASLFYAEYEPARRLMKYVNAGHNPPVVLRPKRGKCEVFRLHSAAMPVGIAAAERYTSATFQFEVNDIFVAYTDGVTEAVDPHGEIWGEARFENLLRSCSEMTPEEIMQRLLSEISAFAQGQPQRDDITLVVMGVQDGCGVSAGA